MKAKGVAGFSATPFSLPDNWLFPVLRQVIVSLRKLMIPEKTSACRQRRWMN